MLYALYGRNPKKQSARAYVARLCKMLCTYAPNLHQRSTDPVAANATYVAKNALVKKNSLNKKFPNHTHTTFTMYVFFPLCVDISCGPISTSKPIPPPPPALGNNLIVKRIELRIAHRPPYALALILVRNRSCASFALALGESSFCGFRHRGRWN